MVMRYHWGMGIGHTYSHGSNSQQAPTPLETSHTGSEEESEMVEDTTAAQPDAPLEAKDTDINNDTPNNSEVGSASELEDRDTDFESAQSDTSTNEDGDRDTVDSESEVEAEYLELYNT